MDAFQVVEADMTDIDLFDIIIEGLTCRAQYALANEEDMEVVARAAAALHIMQHTREKYIEMEEEGNGVTPGAGVMHS